MAPYFLRELVQCNEATIGALAVKPGWSRERGSQF